MTLFVAPKQFIMSQRAMDRRAHVRIRIQIVRCREGRAGITPLGRSKHHVVRCGIHARRTNVRVALQIKHLVKELRATHSHRFQIILRRPIWRQVRLRQVRLCHVENMSGAVVPEIPPRPQEPDSRRHPPRRGGPEGRLEKPTNKEPQRAGQSRSHLTQWARRPPGRGGSDEVQLPGGLRQFRPETIPVSKAFVQPRFHVAQTARFLLDRVQSTFNHGQLLRRDLQLLCMG